MSDLFSNPEFVKLIYSTLGAGGILALVMFLIYRKDSQKMLADWKGQSEALMSVVKENTAAITAHTVMNKVTHEMLQSMHGELSALRDERRQGWRYREDGKS